MTKIRASQMTRAKLSAGVAKAARLAADSHHPVLFSVTVYSEYGSTPLAALLAAALAASPAYAGGTANDDAPLAYFDRPEESLSVAAIGSIWQKNFSGTERFSRARADMDALLANAVHIGEVDATLAGPHFFAAFTFEEDEPMAASDKDDSLRPIKNLVFLPRWQVVSDNGITTATVNSFVTADADTGDTADTILNALEHCNDMALTATNAAARERRLHPLGALVENGGDWFPNAVRQVLAHIGAGVLHKVVLARSWHARVDARADLFLSLTTLRQKFPDCHIFAFAVGGAVFAGATPERLAVVEDGQLFTEAVAGTAPRGDNADADDRLAAQLLNDPKEQREHALVVNAILGALRDAGVRAKAESPASLVTLPYARHLRTPISGKLPKGVGLAEIAATLHPTPATGGVPRTAALAAIRALEPVPRNLFAGPIGWFDAKGGGRLLVGLRGALADAEKIVLHAGAGVVADALPEHENAETQIKLRAMTEVLGRCGG